MAITEVFAGVYPAAMRPIAVAGPRRPAPG